MIPEKDRICRWCLMQLRRAAEERGEIRAYVPLNGRYGPHHRSVVSPVTLADMRDDDLRRMGTYSVVRRIQRTTRVVF